MNVLTLIFAAACAAATYELPPSPPDAPQPDETTISGEGDAVAAHCGQSFSAIRRHTHDTLHRVIITSSPKWGTIWRADSTVPLGKRRGVMWIRTVCWKDNILIRPLEMFDPAASDSRLTLMPGK